MNSIELVHVTPFCVAIVLIFHELQNLLFPSKMVNWSKSIFIGLLVVRFVFIFQAEMFNLVYWLDVFAS